MNNPNALLYEFFLRRAFNIDCRGEDPAGLASADIYNCAYREEDLREARIGLQYGILAMKCKFSNDKKFEDPADYEKIETLLSEADKIHNFKELESVLLKAKELEDYFKLLPDRC